MDDVSYDLLGILTFHYFNYISLQGWNNFMSYVPLSRIILSNFDIAYKRMNSIYIIAEVYPRFIEIVIIV